jgi:hypothetical protein
MARARDRCLLGNHANTSRSPRDRGQRRSSRPARRNAGTRAERGLHLHFPDARCGAARTPRGTRGRDHARRPRDW